MNKIEILAPAGASEQLKAAVSCGANAVYLGTKLLNARKNAGNFDDLELAEAVRYAHIHGVKVYITLNTVIFDEEFSDAVHVIETASRLGADALIIQDMGIYSLVKKLAPDMPLHASTQMAVHNLEGALEAQRLGFQRVVMARELTKDEIKHIRDNTDIEIEVFVHGALCMSVSGQCYLSSMIGERSGNRGLCAQPCRMPFSVDGSIDYALSLKDLTLVDRVDELKEIGVHSLKIEGRMKRPEYVAAAVTSLRNALSGDYVDFDILRSVFSRSGFTKGYFENQINGDMFGIRQKEDVTAAGAVLKDLERLYAHETPVVPLSARFVMQANIPSSLTITDPDGNTITINGDIPEPAMNKPTDMDRVKQALEKTGGTPYYLDKLECVLDDGLVLTVSKMNLMRRDALDYITECRGKINPVAFGGEVNKNHPKRLDRRIPTLRARLLSATQLGKYILEHCEYVSLPIDELLSAIENSMVKDMDKLMVELPRIKFGSLEPIREKLQKLYSLGVIHAWSGNIGAIELARELGFCVHGGYSLNITNSYSLMEYADLKLADTELSFEINLVKAKRLGDYLPYGIIGYGYLPMMTFRNCPIQAAMGCKECGNSFKKMTDRKGVEFMVDCKAGVAEMFNSVPLFLADRLPELEGIDFLTLFFTCEDSYECERITTQYVMGGASYDEKTRGLYYRNVQ